MEHIYSIILVVVCSMYVLGIAIYSNAYSKLRYDPFVNKKMCKAAGKIGFWFIIAAVCIIAAMTAAKASGQVLCGERLASMPSPLPTRVA